MSFIDDIKDYAIKDFQNSNVLPSITIAQAILESGWGKSTLATKGKNLFGIKKGYWQGETITLPTKEYVNGQWITVQAEFRKYNNYGQSISDHSKLLQLGRYYPVISTSDYKEQARQLQRCGYATDPNYANLLIQIIEENKLYKYDVKQQKEIYSYLENGQATVLVDNLRVRNAPSLSGEIVAEYNKGEKFYYDSVFKNDGYYWVSYISYSGVRRYVASREVQGEKYLSCI